MLKNFLNHASPTSLMLWDAASDAASAEEKNKLREQLAKGNTPVAETPVKEEDIIEEKEEGEEETEEAEEEEPELDADGNPVEKVEETAEEKAAREANETEAAKELRKQERIQKRIDKAVAAQKRAEDEVLKWKALAEAKPTDEKLTEEEVQRRADAIANEKLTAQNLNNLQKEFEKNCDKIQAAAEKEDKDFNKKVHELAAEIGPLPNQMLNVLFDLDNGAEVLVYLANDVDEAERIYGLVDKPARLGIALSKIADKLEEKKKPKPKVISKVPDGVKPVNGNRVQSTQITSKDTTPDGMENYVRKRQLQLEQRRKQGR
jgi:hypothetical protein